MISTQVLCYLLFFLCCHQVHSQNWGPCPPSVTVCSNNSDCYINGTGSVKCTCKNGYVGNLCQDLPTQLVSYEPTSNVFNDSFTLRCAFKGLPAPNITWKLNDKIINEIYSEKDLKSLPFSFQIKTIPSEIKVQSTLIMSSGGLCLGGSVISCHGKNIANHLLSTSQNEFNINTDFYEVIKKNYFAFYKQNPSYRDEAETKCESVGGYLASVEDTYIQKSMEAVFRNQLWTNNAWIGLQNSSGTWTWPNHEPALYTNWQDGEPATGKACALMKKSSEWRWKSEYCDVTHAGTASTAGYVCEIISENSPTIVNITSTCLSGKSSFLSVKWYPSVTVVGFLHKVNVSNIVKEITPNDTKEIVTQIFDLTPVTEYNVVVSILPNVCTIPIMTSQHARTSYATPQKVTNATIGLLNNSSNICMVTWWWPYEEIPSVENFVVAVNAEVNHRSELNNSTPNIVEKDSSCVFNVSYQTRNISFSGEPNRRYSAQIFGQSCAGNGTRVEASGNCSTQPAAPPILSSPQVNVSAAGEVSLWYAPVNQIYGPVSCLFIVGQYHDIDDTVQVTRQPSKELLDEIASNDISNLQPGQEYLAVVESNVTENINISLGNGLMTMCDINSFSTIPAMHTGMNVYTATNIELIPGKLYSFYALSTTPIDSISVAFSASNATSYMTKEVHQPPSSEGSTYFWLIGVISGVAVLLVVIFVIVYIRRRKSQPKNHISQTPSEAGHRNEIILSELDDTSPHSEQNFQEGANNSKYENMQSPNSSSEKSTIPLHNFLQVYRSLIEASDHTLEEQFARLSAVSKNFSLKKEVGSSEENKKFNRYKNIIPYDSTRVILEGKHEYINASYIDSFDQPRFFIATQGPLERTIKAFWEMVWEKNCNTIVMLAKLRENGKAKCVQYWPAKDTILNSGRFTISANTEVTFGCYVVRTFSLIPSNVSHKKRGEEAPTPRTVTQFQYTEWPDHGVPVTTTRLLRLHSAVIAMSEKVRGGPIIVHCSAGVGRTGTLIGIDYLLREMKEKSSINIYAAVMSMRRQRCDMVQTLGQYAFLHKVLVEAYVLGNTDFDVSDLNERVRQLTVCAEKEFVALDTIKPMTISQHFGNMAEIKDKNRTPDNAPYDHARLVLSIGKTSEITSYINASVVEEYVTNGLLITTQGPLSNTVIEFWKMIEDCDVKIIVMLTPLQKDNQEMCFRYWPEFPNATLTFNDITVKLIEEDKESCFFSRKLKITCKHATKEVFQLHYQNWDLSNEFCRSKDILGLFNRVTSLRNQRKGSSILVHCSDGLQQTGVFCALINLIERLNAEQRIDVFRTVKDLRDMMPGIVSSLELYKQCFTTLQDYITSFDTYSNFKH